MKVSCSMADKVNMADMSADEIKMKLLEASITVAMTLPADAEFVLTMFTLEDDCLYSHSSVHPKQQAKALIEFGQYFVDKGKALLRSSN